VCVAVTADNKAAHVDALASYANMELKELVQHERPLWTSDGWKTNSTWTYSSKNNSSSSSTAERLQG
jgi:hypothetical protein